MAMFFPRTKNTGVFNRLTRLTRWDFLKNKSTEAKEAHEALKTSASKEWEMRQSSSRIWGILFLSLPVIPAQVWSIDYWVQIPQQVFGSQGLGILTQPING